MENTAVIDAFFSSLFYHNISLQGFHNFIEIVYSSLSLFITKTSIMLRASHFFSSNFSDATYAHLARFLYIAVEIFGDYRAQGWNHLQGPSLKMFY